jgi:hypothetical protein
VAKTLLDGVNQTLLRVNIIAGNAGLLTSLTNSALQHNIDVAIQVINESIGRLYQYSEKSLPIEQAEGSIVLATGVREYALAADFVMMMWPFRDRVNTQYINEYTQGYNALLDLDPQQNQSSQPLWGVISPITGKLRVEFAPDITVNGRQYFYEYEKLLVMVNATDTMPFLDSVFWQMIPVWAELYSRGMRNAFDQGIYKEALGIASKLLTQEKQRTNYSPRG